MLGPHTVSHSVKLVVALACCLAITACGSSSKSSSSGTSSSLALTISDASGGARFTVPTSVKGGVVTVSLKNGGKAPHSAQLVLIKGNHNVQQFLKILAGNSNKTPSWVRAEGGVGLTAPGQTSTATVVLPAGHYGLFELPGPGASGKPASAEFQVTAGRSGSLPGTSTKVTAATAGKDKYQWQLSGSLHAGSNRVTFASKGANAIHLISAVQITGNPSKATIIKALRSNGKPPAFLKVQTFQQTAALDGGKSSVTELNLAAPGRYVLFCPISDRDGGKPHFVEGLLRTVTVK